MTLVIGPTMAANQLLVPSPRPVGWGITSGDVQGRMLPYSVRFYDVARQADERDRNIERPLDRLLAPVAETVNHIATASRTATIRKPDPEKNFSSLTRRFSPLRQGGPPGRAG